MRSMSSKRQWRQFPIPDMIAGTTKEPMTQMADAIKAASVERYGVAYDQLTAACNTCHVSAGRGMIVMKTPDASAYPDQDFGHPNP